MKLFAALAVAALAAGPAAADDLAVGGLKAPIPKDWKEKKSAGAMRLATYDLGDDVELVVFKFGAGTSGSADDNLKRQTAKFKPAKGADKVEEKVEKMEVGKIKATYQDVKGTFLAKERPFDPASKVTEKEDYRQLYVVLPTDDGDFYFSVNGPAKSVEAKKKDFDGFLKALK